MGRPKKSTGICRDKALKPWVLPDKYASGRRLPQGGGLCVLELGTLYVTPAGERRVRDVLAASPGVSPGQQAVLTYRAAGALSYETELFALENGRIYEIVICYDLIEYPYQDRQVEKVPPSEAEDAYHRAATGTKRKTGRPSMARMNGETPEVESDADNDDSEGAEAA